ncbi:MAG: hypothetical protein QOE26_1992 [Verrucomicrobiota bacterium]
MFSSNMAFCSASFSPRKPAYWPHFDCPSEDGDLPIEDDGIGLLGS